MPSHLHHMSPRALIELCSTSIDKGLIDDTTIDQESLVIADAEYFTRTICSTLVKELIESGDIDVDHREALTYMITQEADDTALQYLDAHPIHSDDFTDANEHYATYVDEHYPHLVKLIQEHATNALASILTPIDETIVPVQPPDITAPECGDCEISSLPYKTVVISTEHLPWMSEPSANVAFYQDAISECRVAITDVLSNSARKTCDASALPSEYSRSVQYRLANNYFADEFLQLFQKYRLADHDYYGGVVCAIKKKTNNAPRSYFLKVSTDHIASEDLREVLCDEGIDDLIMVIGHCDKQRQVELLQELTGLSRKQLRSIGIGSV